MGLLSIFSTENSFRGEYDISCSVYNNICFTVICVQAVLCLGLRQMEWLFLSCHNYWIVCRLARDADDSHPYLAYSPEITIKDSSEPFRAFLGAIYLLSRMSPSSVAHTVQMWNLALLRTTIPYETMKIASLI